MVVEVSDQEIVKEVSRINWDFSETDTGYSTHRVHPFTAKFVPQIPEKLIHMYTEEKDIVFDPFCGSGTSLVEAIRKGRQAIGFDINPLFVLVSKVKSTPINSKKLQSVSRVLESIAREVSDQANLNSISDGYEDYIPNYDKLNFWFEDFVVKELAIIKKHVYEDTEKPDVRDLLKVGFSAIIVSVSKQASEARRVRKQKNLHSGEVFLNFRRKIKEIVRLVRNFSDAVPNPKIRPRVEAFDSRKLKEAELPKIDLVVSSTPYPNAFTYHLYHRNRLVWLDIDYSKLRNGEIGSHRKYSKPDGATAETFKKEMEDCLQGIDKFLSPGGICCFVIGNSIIRGDLVDNWILLKEASEKTSLSFLTKIDRNIKRSTKSLNPRFARIDKEAMVFFRK